MAPKFVFGAMSYPVMFRLANCETTDESQPPKTHAERVADEAVRRAIRNLARAKVKGEFQPIIDEAIREGILQLSNEINREIHGLRPHIQREVQRVLQTAVPRAVNDFLRQSENIKELTSKHTQDLDRHLQRAARQILDRIVQEDKYREINSALLRELEERNASTQRQNEMRTILISSVASMCLSYLVVYLKKGDGLA